MATRRPKPPTPPEGWTERTYKAEDDIRALGIDAEVWTSYPHVSLNLAAFEALIALAQSASPTRRTP